jgi:hypothetical protein
MVCVYQAADLWQSAGGVEAADSHLKVLAVVVGVHWR